MQVVKGNISPIWRVGVPSIDVDGQEVSGEYEDLSSNYTCTVAVPDATPAIERAVTLLSSDNKYYLVQLTPAEMATLPVGLVTVAIEVKNTVVSPEYAVEAHVKMKIIDQLIT